MKIVAIQGSHRKEGSTSRLMEAYLKGVQDKNPKVEVEVVHLRDEDIKPCTGCNGCKMGKTGVCVIKDDMHMHYDKVDQADMLVFASPVYWFNMNAQLKTYIDRLYGFDYVSKLKGKKLSLVMTYAAENLEESGGHHGLGGLKDMAAYTQMDLMDTVTASTGMEMKLNQEDLDKAYQQGLAAKMA